MNDMDEMNEKYENIYSELLKAENLSLAFERDSRRYSRFIFGNEEDAQ